MMRSDLYSVYSELNYIILYYQIIQTITCTFFSLWLVPYYSIHNLQ